jgi:hypothetical protein
MERSGAATQMPAFSAIFPEVAFRILIAERVSEGQSDSGALHPIPGPLPDSLFGKRGATEELMRSGLQASRSAGRASHGCRDVYRRSEHACNCVLNEAELAGSCGERSLAMDLSSFASVVGWCLARAWSPRRRAGAKWPISSLTSL